uniref:Transposase n=1 Tax=Mesocestoides corti TaxID=53468 RepID=A0A5K3FTJ8_MESCO
MEIVDSTSSGRFLWLSEDLYFALKGIKTRHQRQQVESALQMPDYERHLPRARPETVGTQRFLSQDIQPRVRKSCLRINY